MTCAALCLLAAGAAAAELKPETSKAFDAYVHAAEGEMARELEIGRFLIIDRLPEARRQQAYRRVRQGGLYIEQLHAQEAGQPLRVPSGLIHDWAGVMFIPGANLADASEVLDDYAREQNIYSPEIQQSKVLSRDGDTSKIFLRLYYKSLATAVLNASFDNRLIRLGDNRVVIESHSTRVAEVKDPAQPDEHELPVGKDSGYLWRMATYWRIEARDGGVYLQIETIGLTRSIPPLLLPIVAPLTHSIPRNVLTDFLDDTRVAIRGNAARNVTENGGGGKSLGRAAKTPSAE